MNSPILTWRTGTPTARALAALPPTAKIQLPILVRISSQVPTATKKIHHSTVMLTFMKPSGDVAAKIALAAAKPSICEALLVATVPVTDFVTPRLMPRSMKNVASVIRKLGIPVLTTRYPLMKPMPSAISRLTGYRPTCSARAGRDQRRSQRGGDDRDAGRDRSNSPPIISRATPTATMPIVELA